MTLIQDSTFITVALLLFIYLTLYRGSWMKRILGHILVILLGFVAWTAMGVSTAWGVIIITIGLIGLVYDVLSPN